MASIFGDNEKITEALNERINSLETTLTELLKHTFFSEQHLNTQNLGEIKKVWEAHKQAAQDIVGLLGTIQAKNDELNAAGTKINLVMQSLQNEKPKPQFEKKAFIKSKLTSKPAKKPCLQMSHP